MKVLIATDGSDFSRQAIKQACEILNSGKNNSIEIISIFEAVPYFEQVAYAATEPSAAPANYVHEVEKMRRAQATQFASEAEEIVRALLIDSSTELTTKVIKGDAARAIVEEAGKWGADMIVMGSHGRGFWRRTLVGSVSQAVVQHAPCSVLINRMTTESAENLPQVEKIITAKNQNTN